MTKKIAIINGPNLNLLGKREPNIYGGKSFEDYLQELKLLYKDCEIDYFQSNIEGEIIDKIQELGFEADGIILNAGGYTHTSVAIADAIKAVDAPVVEVHISNVDAREDFRRISMIGPVCIGSISGFGLKSYELAVGYLFDLKSE
ncbi:MAG: type II 3-dehydroquinate dehydratase [Bacteroidales bacterium]|nr:type II 3-dehydroquinate dehydratase [Bacteroidales bacterium]